jgi:hypothetical protein
MGKLMVENETAAIVETTVGNGKKREMQRKAKPPGPKKKAKNKKNAKPPGAKPKKKQKGKEQNKEAALNCFQHVLFVCVLPKGEGEFAC